MRERSQATVRSLLLRDAYGVITPFRVPTLEEALAWSRGRAVLMLDVKEVRYMETILDGILRHGAENRVVVITYTLMDALHVHGRAPEVMISVQAGRGNRSCGRPCRRH